jgi:hypothetical protein
MGGARLIPAWGRFGRRGWIKQAAGRCGADDLGMLTPGFSGSSAVEAHGAPFGSDMQTPIDAL